MSAACGHENPVGARFCTICGTPLECPRCAECQAELPPGARFCSQCGAEARGLIQPQPALQAEGELRSLTVLFCDLVGSTELALRLDPEELREVVGAYHRVSAEVIARHRGHVAQYLGDGILAYFGYPRIYEDSVEQAVLAGLAIQQGLAALNQRPGAAVQLHARVGIHTGRVLVGEVGSGEHRETLALGSTTNHAARVQEVADAGTVLLTEESQRLVADRFEFEDAGRHAMKGIQGEVRLLRAVRPLSAGAAAPRALTSFVGRDAELASLSQRWSLAREGHGQVMLVVGEPGIGKSRLLERFGQALSAENPLWAASGGSRNAQHTPFGTIAGLVRSSFGLEDGDADDDPLDTIERGLREGGLEPETGAPLLAELLSLDAADRYPPLLSSPGQRRIDTIHLLVNWLVTMDRGRPSVLIVEDLHWADPSTLEALKALVDQVASSPVLLLLTARPEFRAPWPLRGHHGVLTLTRLPAAEVREMIQRASGRHPLLDAVLESLVERSDGVPLFAEELARTLRERIDVATAPDQIPETLQDSLLARLDRLGAAREVAQLAAVIGREFSHRLLREITGLDDAILQASLDKMVRVDFFDVRGMGPDATYLFRHALIQQAAYDSLLKRRRREIHRRVAETLRDGFPAEAEAHPEQLARHWASAGEAAEAVGAWRQPGQRASNRGAYEEAIAHHEMAIEALSKLPESAERAREELDLQVRLASAIQMGRSLASPEAAAASARARDLVEKVGDAAERIAVLSSLWTVAFSANDLPAATELSEQMERVAEEADDPTLRRAAYAARSGTVQNAQDLEAGRVYALRCIALRDQAQADGRVEMQSLLYGALSSIHVGRIVEGREQAREMVARAEADSPVAIVLAAHSATPIATWLRDMEWVDELTAKVAAALEGIDMPFFQVGNELFAGWAQAMRGDAAGGLARLSPSLDGYLRQGQRLGLTHYLSLLAEAQLAAGAIDAGLATCDRALSTGHPGYWQRSEAQRLRAALLATGGAGAKEVEEAYRKALSLARDSGARLLELRAGCGLTLHLVALGRAPEGRALLEPLFAAFRDGFEIADLRMAAALLEQTAG